MLKRYIIHLALMSLLLISFSCGKGGDGDDAPVGSTITVNPSDITLEAISGDTIVNITAFIQNQDGIPLNNVELFISGPFAAPRDPARYQFYREFDAGDPTNSSFTAVTNENGVCQFSIKIFAVVGGVPSAFTDNISIQAQSAFASIDISLGQTASP